MKNGDWRINRSPSVTSEGHKKQYERVKGKIFEILGNVCKRCGFSDRRALQFDHINGGGAQERKVKRGTSYFYNILTHIQDFQILCANCNWIKRAENKEHCAPVKG